jgi:hypothetical protein
VIGRTRKDLRRIRRYLLTAAVTLLACVFAAGTVRAAGGPTVVTGEADQITETSATLNGTVDPNGEEVGSCRFEYGKNEVTEQQATCASIPPKGSEPEPVSAALIALTPNTTYKYRLVATTPAGTGMASEVEFTTVAEAPEASTSPASSVGAHEATLNGSVNPKGATVEKCAFKYGVEGNPEEHEAPCTPTPEAIDEAQPVSAVVSGLTAGARYEFFLELETPGGIALTPLPTTFTTSAGAKPVVLTGSADPVRATAATLNGSVNPEGAAVIRCEFEYGTASLGEYEASCSSLPAGGEAAVAVSASVEGLEPGSEYKVRLVAETASGKGEGAEASFATGPLRRPQVVTEPASTVATRSATLNGTVNPEGEDATKCEFEYGTASVGEHNVSCSSLPAGGEAAVAVSASVEGLEPGSEYKVRLVADTTGGRGEGVETAFTTPAPEVQADAASSLGETSATLNGTVDPRGGQVESCSFEYGTAVVHIESVPCAPSPGKGVQAVAVSAPVAGLSPGTSYLFRVVVVEGRKFFTSEQVPFTTPGRPPGSGAAGQEPLGSTAALGYMFSEAPQPNSAFTASRVASDPRSGALTFTISVLNPGTLRWTATFPNGRFGVFSAKASRCKAGKRRLRGRCRSATVLFAKGTKTIPAAGSVSFVAAPSRAARRALRRARRKHRRLTVTATIEFQSSLGGEAVVREQTARARLAKRG